MLRQMEQARQRGFDIALIFIATDNAEINIDRITGRVAHGGHHVPEQDVRRRYARSMENALRAIELTHRATIIDNTSDQGPRVVLEIEAGTITAQAQGLPRWITMHLGAFIAQQRGQ